MCGLAAFLAHGPGASPADREELARTGAAMAARGPDGAGTWVSADGAVGLVHRRLAIIDTSQAGAQPMHSADGRLVIAFNGEIYNHRALRAGLEQQGVRFRSGSDTEVLLHLYAREGEAMLVRLRGMFAIALWDEDRRALLLARDGFGIKPLYLSDNGRELRAASQVKALLAGGGVDTAPSAAGHASFFLWGHVAEPFTLYRAITALPAGTALWAGADGSRRQWRFCDPLVPSDGPAPDLAEAVRDSLNAHMVADVPVGLFLSGGLDSATLAALSGPVQAVTLGFREYEGTGRDEVPLAAMVADHYGLSHHVDMIGQGDFLAARDRILADMDQPSIDGINTWMVARAASRQGLKVALSGLGGDELFAGYNSFSQIPRLVQGLSPLRRVPGLGRGFRLATQGWLHRFAPPKAAGLLELGPHWGGAYLLRRGLFMPWELPALLGGDMARSGLAELSPLAALEAAHQPFADARSKVTALEGGFYMRNQLLRDADWAGMAHGVEIRVPLVDGPLWSAVGRRVARNLPSGKQDLAACAAPPLPPALLNRPKTGFFVPVAQWIQGGGDLRGWARAVHAHFSGSGAGG